MAHELEPIFRELGLSQYLDTFVDQGFDCWDTILDIQESDLDALGVKLGHRRKLQRRIANARGIAPSISLGPSSKQSGSDDSKSDVTRPETTRSDNGPHEGNGVMKRKYRRHPKADENAPERPPSAYVLFSNKMREDLKSQSLTFTEIAKLVGENWQNLPAKEKEIYEGQANAAKEKYHRDLVEYKKTAEYRRYASYLQDFKEKQAKQSTDSSKRLRLEPARLRHGSTSSSATPTTSTATGNSSGSPRSHGLEYSPNRTRRGGSIASLTESQHSSTAPTPLPHRNSLDEPGPSPLTVHFDSANSHDPSRGHARRGSHWTDNGRNTDSAAPLLPPLSDVLDERTRHSSAGLDGKSYPSGFVAANHRRPVPNGPPSFVQGGSGRIPLLQHESSSSGSISSIGSMNSNMSASTASTGFSRASKEPPLPIHALLGHPGYERSPPVTEPGVRHPLEKPIYVPTTGPRGYGFQSAPSAFQDMRFEQSADGDVVMTSDDAAAGDVNNSGKARFDGMSALLRAGEIVGRDSHQ